MKKSACERRPSLPTALMLGLLFLPLANAETVTTFDDITFWVGAGANRAAIVIDWDDTTATDEALTWGYRWNGTSTGEDMLLTVLEADARLFAKRSIPGTFGAGTALFGLGYNLDDNSEFGISDGTVFDSNGIAFISGGLNDNVVPPATATYPEDLYAEGWFTGYWNYSLSNGNPLDGGEWTGSTTGMAGRTLADGDWDSWAFTPTFDFTAFAENPVAAEVPFSADFDSDDDVDGSDFLAWQRGFGIAAGASLELGDANGDGAIDELDLQLWASVFGSLAASKAVNAIPEPSSFTFVFVTMFLFLGTRYFDAGRTLWRSF